jgi:2,4-dienoyl-CoA reductase-like NADH-dependent reductase (Old Yellow Enzyme family)
MIDQPFSLPCGAALKNRIAKAAMTERLAGKDHLPGEKHVSLYHHWAKNGTGLLISGNIMVHRKQLESSGNVVLDRASNLSPFREWTSAVTRTGAAFWAQILSLIHI